MNMDMQALIEEMSALIVKIKSGSATQGEIEAFAAAAAQVHERAVVLRYKSYEAKVFGTPVAPVIEPERTPAPGPVAEPTAEIAPEPVSEVLEDTEEEAVSFDLFQEQESEAFDLFSLDSEPEEESVESVFAVMTPTPEPEPEIAAPDPVAETPAMEDPEEEEPTLQLEEAASHQTEEPQETTPPVSMPEPVPVAQEPVHTPAPEPAAPVAAAPSGTIHPVYKRLVTDDNSLGARLMAVRLETLQGAFGFNERLQIIRELFDGSNEQFSQAISQLDSLGSKAEARNVVSSYAHQFAWDKDSDLALEFVQKVERRYA